MENICNFRDLIKEPGNMYEKYYITSKSISDIVYKTDIVAQEQVKRSSLYLEWLIAKSKYFEIEKLPLVIPHAVFPMKISQFVYDKSNTKVKKLINKHYTKSETINEYSFNPCEAIEYDERKSMLHSLVLIRGNVVWVEFGFNVGCEFGGKHPAIILKNVGDIIVVAPLTSGTLEKPRPFEVVINVVYNLPKRNRYTSITRIIPISIYRVDLNSPVGSVHSRDLLAVFHAMKEEWNL